MAKQAFTPRLERYGKWLYFKVLLVTQAQHGCILQRAVWAPCLQGTLQLPASATVCSWPTNESPEFSQLVVLSTPLDIQFVFTLHFFFFKRPTHYSLEKKAAKAPAVTTLPCSSRRCSPCGWCSRFELCTHMSAEHRAWRAFWKSCQLPLCPRVWLSLACPGNVCLTGCLIPRYVEGDVFNLCCLFL